MLACRSLLARASRLTRPLIPRAAGPPLRCFHQGSVGQNKLVSFVMEGAQGGSSNLAKHKKRKSPVQRWRPISTEAVPEKDDVNDTPISGSRLVVEECITSSENLASDGETNVVIEVTTNDASLSKYNSSLESSSTKVVIEDNVEVSGFNKGPDGSDVSETYSSSIEVDIPLMRFVKGKGGSMQKKIEEDTGVKIIFPSSREETSVENSEGGPRCRNFIKREGIYKEIYNPTGEAELLGKNSKSKELNH